jgi:hypothetical protein
MLIIECAQQQCVLPEEIAILKPKVVCTECSKRFADNQSLQTHTISHTKSSQLSSPQSHITPKSMSVDNLKKELRVRGLSSSGRKDVLIRRLEGVLATDI